jgi:transcriptional regulator with XRE-family HTH domain
MINERLKNLRKHYNKKQNDIAEYIGVARSTYTNYENGNKNPPYEQLIKIAEFYSVSVDYLLGRTDDPTPYRDVDSDLNGSPDEELKQLLNDPEMRVAFMDYSSWTDEDKRELINFIKFKKSQREMKENK